jgi:hypothetical protein
LIEDSVDFVPISAPTWALNALYNGLCSCIMRMVIFSGRLPLVHILSFIFSGSLPSYFPWTMKCFKAYELKVGERLLLFSRRDVQANKFPYKYIRKFLQVYCILQVLSLWHEGEYNIPMPNNYFIFKYLLWQKKLK